MTALEKILSEITGDAQKEAEELRAEAEKEAEAILAAAKADREKRAQAILEKGRQEAEALSARAASSAELDRRNAMLRFKQELIGQAVADADAALNNAPPEAYFAALAALYRRYAQKGDAVLRLNARDLARLPEGFLQTLKEANPEGNVTLGEAPADIDGGFLLSFGGVDVNCSFSALIEAGESTLRDLCAKRLFAPED